MELHSTKYGYLNPFLIKRHIFLERIMDVSAIIVEICYINDYFKAIFFATWFPKMHNLRYTKIKYFILNVPSRGGKMSTAFCLATE